MFRRSVVCATAAAVVWSVSVDLSACGDKFVRAGRSARARGYAAIYPAAILLYKPDATPKGLKEFEAALEKAGHKPVVLKDGAALSQTLSASKFDVVIADYADATMVKAQFRGGSADPSFLPILHKPTKALEAEVRKEHPCYLNVTKMTKYDALEEIDHLMEVRLKKTTIAVSR